MPGIELLRDSLIKPAPSSSETAPPQTTVKEATEDEHGLMPEPSDKKRRKASGELQPEWIPLLLPSDLPREVRLNMCSELLIEKETKLRMAQADDSLQQVRQNLRVKNGVWTYKRVHVEGSGQKPNTRAQSMLNRFQERIFRYVMQSYAYYSGSSSSGLLQRIECLGALSSASIRMGTGNSPSSLYSRLTYGSLGSTTTTTSTRGSSRVRNSITLTSYPEKAIG